VTTASATERA